MSYITLHRSSTIDSTSHVSHSQLNEDVFAILSDEDGDEEGSVDDEKFSIRDEFNSMMTDIKQGATILETHGDGLRVLGGDGSPADEDRAALYAGVFERLDRSCQWLPAMLVENVPKGKHKFQRFKPILDILIQHPTCHDFFTWKNSAQGETLLHEAARNNHKGLILYICLQRPEQGKAGLEEKSYNGLTCLHIAAQRQNPDPDLMTLLLAQVGNSGAMIKGTGGNTLLHVAVDIQRCHPGQERVVEILLSAAKDAITEKNDQGLTPLRHHHNTKKATLGYNAAKQNATADQIEMMLRLSCLRLDISRDKTWEILYSNPTERREFTFDLYGYEEIRAEDLENLSGHICLETILKSVVVPDLIVRPPDEFVISPPDPEKPWENGIAAANAGYANGNAADEQLLNEGDDDRASIDIPTGCPGRIDYCWIFKWLRGPAQGVAKIIKLSVKDQKHKSHSDEAIEWCLKHTDVEVLDWNKLDICSTVFTNAAPKVRNLTVYCSGNNAVLRSWLSPEGLVELKDLEVLNLKIVLGLESLQRTTAQARNFKTKYLEQRKQWCQRLEHKGQGPINHPPCAKHEVKVHWEIVGSDGKSVKAKSESEDDKKAEAEKQEWISCMEKFASFIRGYRESIEETEEPHKHPPRVKLALIDDGVDGLNADLSCVIAAGQTFSEREDQQYNSYFKSAHGHGTIMAMLIRKVCPNVRLYVAKLNEEKTGRNTFSITAESVVKAILWAIEHRVNILSMSFTISQVSDQATVQSLIGAINQAVQAGVLIFCSVSDGGAQESSGAYPASCNRSNSFLIGTATAAGRAWKWNGAGEVDYILPGTDLEVRVGDELFDGRLKSLCESGSSLATALASGLAALVMDCVALHDPAEFARLRDRAHAKMKMALDSINTRRYNNPDDDKYLRVWNTFGKALGEGRGSDGEKLRFVVDGLMSRVRMEAGPEPAAAGGKGKGERGGGWSSGGLERKVDS